MNAHKFLAEFGIDEAKRVLEVAPNWATNFNQQVGYTKASNSGEYTVYKNQINGGEEYSLHFEMGLDIEELKRLVESVDLVELLGGIESLKALVNISNSPFSLSHITREDVIYSIDEIKQAIADYELVQANKNGEA